MKYLERRNLNKKPVLTVKDPEPEAEPRHRSRNQATPSVKIGPPGRGGKRPNDDVDEPTSSPLTKRKRGDRKSIGSEETSSAVKIGKPSPATRQQPVAGPSQTKRRGPPGIRPEVITASPSKPPPAAPSDGEVNTIEVEDITRPPSDSAGLFGSDPVEDTAPVESISIGPPKRRTSMRNINSPKKSGKQPEPEPEAIAIGPPRRKASGLTEDAMPTHRARKANPRVKLMEDHIVNESTNGGISTKAKFLTGAGKCDSEVVNGYSPVYLRIIYWKPLIL